MRKFKLFIYTGLALTIILLGVLLGWKVLIQEETPGFFIIGISVLLVISAVFCVISAAAIDRGHGRLITRLWMSLFALVFFYFLADCVGGLIFIRPIPFHNFPDEYLHHKMSPRMRYVLHDPDSGAEFEMVTNNLGFRGGDVLEKNPGIYRIVITGDSFTMGDGISDADAFPLHLERLLNESGSRNHEVINCGVVSYTPLLEYLLLKKYIGLLKPDMVILGFDMSDLLQEYVYRKIASTDESGDVTAVDGYTEYDKRKSSLYLKSLIWIRQNMFITSSIIEILGRRSGNDESADFDVVDAVERENSMLLLHTLDAPQLKESAEMYRMAEDSIQRAKRLCDVHGCKFILSVYPWGHQVNEREWLPGRYDYIPRDARISDRTVGELERFAHQNGIVFFNAFPAFRGYTGGERLYFSRNPHWTPAGQRLMAKSLAGFIEEDLKKGD